MAVVRDIGDLLPVIGELYAQSDLVAARRIDVMDLGTERVTKTASLRMFVVIEDHFLVHLLHPHQAPTPKNSLARTIALASASTSSRVLYAANDARAVAATPNLLCSGQAQ